MALTRPKFYQVDTTITAFNDPITVLHSGATQANVDVGFLFNRANGLVSNVALVWSEATQSFITAYTDSAGTNNSNISATSYANIKTGNITAAAFFWANGAVFSSSSYGNTDVAAYLPTDATITGIQGNLGSFQTYANLHFGDSTYGNTQVGAYLPTDATITGIQANLGAYQGWANTRITAIDANLGTATTNITTLFSNAAGQANQITGANAAIVTANAAVVSFVGTINNNLSTAITANTNAANSAIITANTGLKSYVDTQDSAITTAWTANAATQATSLNSINANIGAYYQYANANLGAATTNITTLQSNAGAQQSQINSIVTNANTNVAAYLPTYSGSLGGTLTTAAQTNITSVGTLTGLTSSGIVNITNSTQSNDNTTGALVVTGGAAVGANLHVGGSLHITGNLEVNGTQTIFNTNVSVIQDSMIYMGDDNTGDSVDIGFISSFTNPGYQHTGFVRDASDGTWKLFANVVAEPTTVVDFTNATYSPLKVGRFTANGNVNIDTGINGNAFVISGPGGSNPNFIMSGPDEQTFRFFNSNTTVGSSTRVSWKLANRNNVDWAWIMYTDRAGNGADDFVLQKQTAGVALYIDASANVGLGGNVAPQHKLSVNGTLYASGNAAVSNLTGGTITGTTGSFTNLSGTLSTAAQTNITSLGTLTSLAVSGTSTISVSSSSDALRITQTGAGNAFVVEDSVNPDATAFVITANGQVGVGNVSPQATLHVKGNSGVGGRHTDFIVEAEDTGNARFFLKTATNNRNWEFFAAGDDGGFGVYDGVGVARRFTILPSGNVGINSSTPISNLSIGTTTVTSTATPITVDLGGTYSSSAGSNGKLKVWYDGSTSYMGLGVSANQLDYIVSSSSYSHVWYQGGAEKMRIAATSSNVVISTTTASTSSTTGALVVAGGVGIAGNLNVGGTLNTFSGNVGIGNTAPVSKLHVQGATSGDGGSFNGTGSALYVKQDTTWSGNQPWALYVSGYSYLNGFRINANDGIRALYKTSAGGQLGFATTGDDPITFTQSDSLERMRIAVGGNVVVTSTTTSTSSTTGALVVKGGVGVAGQLSVASNISLSESGGSGTRTILSSSGSGAIINHNDNSDVFLQTQGNTRIQILNGSGIVSFPYGITANTSGIRSTFANIITTNGVYWANGAAYSSGSGGTTYTSTGAGNVTISGSTINLTASGPGAASVGSSTAIPVITTDAYGRVASTSTAAVVAPASTLTGSTLASGVTASSLTSVGILTGLTVNAQFSGNTAYADSDPGNYDSGQLIAFANQNNITGVSFSPTDRRVLTMGIGPVRRPFLRTASGVPFELQTGNVIVSSTTTSTSTTTGALVVVGGVGVSGSINVGGTASKFTGCVTVGSSATPSLPLTIAADGYNARISNVTNQFGYNIGRNTTDGLLYFYGDQTGYPGYVFSGVDGERMRITATGNVGIGTTTPTSTLHVKKGTNATYFEPTGNWAGKIFNATDAANEHGLVVGNRLAAVASTAFEVGGTYGGGTGAWRSYFKIDGLGGLTMSSAGLERVRMDDGSGNLVINSTTTSTSTTTGALVVKGGVGIAGALNATTKSFIINHPTKPDMKLRYGSLEGPEFGVYVRGRLTDANIIELPDYWTGLVNESTVTVQLTPIGQWQQLYVGSVANNTVTINSVNDVTIDCYYTVYAERKDIDSLIVEYADK